jgi:hypothetical protein
MKNTNALLLLTLLLFVQPLCAGTIHVSPTGNDSQPGTETQPLATLKAAQKLVRQFKGEAVTVYLHTGIHRLDSPLVFTLDDSRTRDTPVVWKAYGAAKPVISGGIEVTGWTSDKNGIWKAHLDRTKKLRQLYVNDRPAEMAALYQLPKEEKINLRTFRGAVSKGWYGSFVVKGDEPWATGEADDSRHAGMLFDPQDLPDVKHPKDMEILQGHQWTITRVGVEDVKTVTDANGVKSKAVILQQPMGVIGECLGWGCGFNAEGAGRYNTKWPFHFYNAYEFLDQPGEFYFDRSRSTVYYKPRVGETMETARVVAPVTDRLILIQGEDLTRHVVGIHFEGICFAHTGWQMNIIGDSCGAPVIQSSALQMKFKKEGNIHKRPYPLYSSTDLPASTVEINFAEDIRFTDSIFRCLGCMGINVQNDVHYVDITGNVFQWIEGAAVNTGHPQHGFIGKMNGDNDGWGPYNIDNSTDRWDESHEGLVKNVLIKNNLLRNVCTNWWNMAMISHYYGHSVYIEHNDIYGAPYSSLSLGWGWGEFTARGGKAHSIQGNKIGNPSLSNHDIRVIGNRIEKPWRVLYDSGAIYTLSNLDIPNKNPKAQKQFALVKGNYLRGDSRRYCYLLYTDEASAYLRVDGNVLDGFVGTKIKGRGKGSSHKHLVNNYIACDQKLAETLGTIGKRHDEYWHTEGNRFLDWSNRNVPYPTDKWPEAAEVIIEKTGLEPEYKDIFEHLVSMLD